MKACQAADLSANCKLMSGAVLDTLINTLVPDAHYSERRNRLASLQNKLFEVSL